MKVLKFGYIRTITCPHCEAVLRYHLKKDVECHPDLLEANLETGKDMQYHYLTCPVCDNEIDVTKIVYDYYDKMEGLMFK